MKFIEKLGVICYKLKELPYVLFLDIVSLSTISRLVTCNNLELKNDLNNKVIE